jgi:hypothetical protein
VPVSGRPHNAIRETTRERPAEREREIAALESGVARACTGRGGLITVVGAAGTGKTRLLAHAARIRGVAVLRGTAHELNIGGDCAENTRRAPGMIDENGLARRRERSVSVEI